MLKMQINHIQNRLDSLGLSKKGAFKRARVPAYDLPAEVAEEEARKAPAVFLKQILAGGRYYMAADCAMRSMPGWVKKNEAHRKAYAAAMKKYEAFVAAMDEEISRLVDSLYLAEADGQAAIEGFKSFWPRRFGRPPEEDQRDA